MFSYGQRSKCADPNSYPKSTKRESDQRLAASEYFYDTILNIEAEEYDIAVLHHVVLALHAYQPFFSGCIVGTAV